VLTDCFSPRQGRRVFCIHYSPSHGLHRPHAGFRWPCTCTGASRTPEASPLKPPRGRLPALIRGFEDRLDASDLALGLCLFYSHRKHRFLGLPCAEGFVADSLHGTGIFEATAFFEPFAESSLHLRAEFRVSSHQIHFTASSVYNFALECAHVRNIPTM